MKQIIQSFRTGLTSLEDIPVPKIRRGTVLIRSTCSLVSLGTERMLVEFAKSNLFQKAKQQPEKVKEVVDKFLSEGFRPTLNAVFNKLDQPIPLGYCNVGEVIEVGEGVMEFKVGDRVVSNGSHAEYVCVSKNLVASIPKDVSDEDATFAVIGSIGLQGIRLCNPTFGETIVVIGLGLIGLLTAELLKGNGCRVIGIDLDSAKVNIAKEKGIIAINPSDTGLDIVRFVNDLTDGIGADGIIITASTSSQDIISQAAKMSRKRGRIILVGVIGLNIKRSDFYEKELTFQVSCSYGPGRYDDEYEIKGNDYPLPYVRWTEKRNFNAILEAIKNDILKVAPLITERLPLESFNEIYQNIGNSKSIASIIFYSNNKEISRTISLPVYEGKARNGIGVGIIGAGNFVRMTMLPALKRISANLISISSRDGVTGTELAKKYRIIKSSTDPTSVIKDLDVDLVVIATRHDSHADYCIEALKARKHVFVEKPLAIKLPELEEIINAYDGTKTLNVGFNRRFSPHVIKMKQLVEGTPVNIIATMNAGNVVSTSWIHDMNIGGGRIVGEACHYIDLITFLAGSQIESVCMQGLGVAPFENSDNATILLKCRNGSSGVINYFSNGAKSYSKERIEIYSQGKTLIMDNFQVTRGYGYTGFNTLKTGLNKGHETQFKLLIESIEQGKGPIIPFDNIINVTKASFAAIESLKQRSWIDL